MRLVTRLSLSHLVLAAIAGAGLVAVLLSVLRINNLMTEMRERELATLDEEEAIHRAAWKIEVAARHGLVACDAGTSSEEVASRMAGPLDGLHDTLERFGPQASKRILAVALRYEAWGRRMVQAKAVCDELHSSESRSERLSLDEEMTDAWIARLFEIHRQLYATEEQARRAGGIAIVVVTAIGALSLLGALVAARKIARGVSEPLATLAKNAERVGKGDFTPFGNEAKGPIEVVELSRDLDRMRGHLAELDALKQGFVASVSHELRTPLAKIREALALLGDGAVGELTDRQRRVVRIARDACEKQIHMVSTLLDLSRLRARKIIRVETGQLLDSVLREAITLERSSADAAGVEITLEAEGAAPPMALDGPLIERALANLVRNAVTASPRGETVAVARELMSEGPDGTLGPWVKIQVSDAGPGIPQELRHTLFDAFVTQPIQKGIAGVGLGLTLAREVVRAHGGDVTILDRDPPGATFVVWIPIAQVRPSLH